MLSVLAHPGFAKTNLASSGAPGPVNVIMRIGNAVVAQSAERGASSQLRAATAPDVEGGQFFGPGGLAGMWGPPVVLRPGPKASDPDTAARLWAVSAELTGVAYQGM